jgi:hypothetical protein
MKVANLTPEIVEELRRIHGNFHGEEFPFPDFSRFLGSAVILDDNDVIISAGGVKPHAELVVITNKIHSPRDRRNAILQLLQSSIYTCGRANVNQLHAFIKDPKWLSQVKHYGFVDCKGTAVCLEL